MTICENFRLQGSSERYWSNRHFRPAFGMLKLHNVALAFEDLFIIPTSDQASSFNATVQVKLKTVQRRSRLVFLPAFVLNYYFGEHFNVDGVRRPEAFQAVIGGQADSAVAAERHFSPAKVTRILLQLENGTLLQSMSKQGGKFGRFEV